METIFSNVTLKQMSHSDFFTLITEHIFCLLIVLNFARMQQGWPTYMFCLMYYILPECNGIGRKSYLSAQNIQSYNGCTLIDGNVKIVMATFNG